MRRALLVGLGLGIGLTGCAETGNAPFWSASPALKPAATLPPPAPPVIHKEAVIPVPPPKPKLMLYLDVMPADSGLETALRDALKTKAGHLDVRRVSGKPPVDGLQLSLRHFRWNEDQRTENTHTVTYRADQVRDHVLPDGAVYQVDHLSGKATVGFSFRLTLERDGKKLAENEISDHLIAPWSTCRLARIVELSGAAKAAPFVANPDMRTLCAGKAAPAISTAVVLKLADAVLALPLTGK